MDFPVTMREMPAWIADGMEILEEKAAFLNMACMAIGHLPVDRVEEISTPQGWKGLSWYTLDFIDELRRMKDAANGREPND